MIINSDCFQYIKTIESGSVDLILTDPPYDISKESNFRLGESKRFNSISIDFGDWDESLDLNELFVEFYRVLRKGGTLILFYDIWKSNQVREASERAKFRQPRVGVWLKNNPTPVNSKWNYLSNAAEYFFTFVKDKNATFNSKYDNGVYNYPLCHGKERLEHPTQKPLGLIKDLIEKHSKPNDLVLDTFSGSGTTAEAAILTGRRFICIERDENYYNLSLDRIKQLQSNLI